MLNGFCVHFFQRYCTATVSDKHFILRYKRQFSLPKVLSVTLRGVVRIFGTDSASEVGIFKRRRKETEEVVNIEEKRFLRGGREAIKN